MEHTGRLEERILGLLMGLGMGVVIGFFLRETSRKAGEISALAR